MSSSSTTANARLLPDDPVSDAELLIGSGRAREAVAHLDRSRAKGRGGLLLMLTLQKALLASGENHRALECARETALTNPQVALAALALGEALHACGHLPTAIAEYQRTLRLDPSLDAARVRLGSAWLDAGEAGKALEVWREISNAESQPALTEKILDAESAFRAARSDARYVRHLFDQFSAEYDMRMIGQLAYRAPKILRDLAQMLGLAAENRYAVLDLGCGTGLMGEAVRDWARHLVGVDLSPAMIEKARERGIYDELAIGDICSWLSERRSAYDLIFAADTLVYLGDLSLVFAGAAARLSPRGSFLFTVEKKADDTFELGPKRRWRHSEGYIRAEAARNGLSVAGLMGCWPRTESGAPVDGLAVALAKL